MSRISDGQYRGLLTIRANDRPERIHVTVAVYDGSLSIIESHDPNFSADPSAVSAALYEKKISDIEQAAANLIASIDTIRTLTDQD